MLVRASVSRILLTNGKATGERNGKAKKGFVAAIIKFSYISSLGVAVERKEGEVCIHAPIIISDAGLFNTYNRLLPPEIKAAPGIRGKHFITSPSTPLVSINVVSCFLALEVASLLSSLQHGMGCFLVFVGLCGTSEELGLKSTNLWIYPESDLNGL